MAIISNNKLAFIHIVKKELKLSDADYRNILQEVAGVDTARDITDKGFRKLMRYLVKSRYYKLNPQGLTLRQKLYIDQMAAQLGWSLSHLQNFMKKYYHVGSIGNLNRKEAVKLIESLKNVKKHSK